MDNENDLDLCTLVWLNFRAGFANGFQPGVSNSKKMYEDFWDSCNFPWDFEIFFSKFSGILRFRFEKFGDLQWFFTNI